MNLYGYAAGDPINNADPLGLCGPLTTICARITLYFLTRAAPMIARAGAAMTGLYGPSPAVATQTNARAAATLGRLTAVYRGNIDKLDDMHLDAAVREQAGEIVALKPNGDPFDHLQEVRNAMQGMRNVVAGVNRLVNNGQPTVAQRAEAQLLREEAIRALQRAQEAGVRSH